MKLRSTLMRLLFVVLLASGNTLAQQPNINEMEQRARALQAQYEEMARLTQRGAQVSSLANIGYAPDNSQRFTGLEFVATEITQILNNIQLALQLIQQIQAVRTLADQYADMLANSRRAVRYNFKDLTGILGRTEQKLNERLNLFASVLAPNHRMGSQENIVASFRNLYGSRYDGAQNGAFEELAWRRLEGQIEGAMQSVATARETNDDIDNDIQLLSRLTADIVNSQGRHQTLQAQAQMDQQAVQQSIRIREQLNQLASLMARQQANDYSREMADRRSYRAWSNPWGRSPAPLEYRGR